MVAVMLLLLRFLLMLFYADGVMVMVIRNMMFAVAAIAFPLAIRLSVLIFRLPLRSMKYLAVLPVFLVLIICWQRSRWTAQLISLERSLDRCWGELGDWKLELDD